MSKNAREKQVRRRMHVLQYNFGFEKPYKVLCDGNFLQVRGPPQTRGTLDARLGRTRGREGRREGEKGRGYRERWGKEGGCGWHVVQEIDLGWPSFIMSQAALEVKMFLKEELPKVMSAPCNPMVSNCIREELRRSVSPFRSNFDKFPLHPPPCLPPSLPLLALLLQPPMAFPFLLHPSIAHLFRLSYHLWLRT